MSIKRGQSLTVEDLQPLVDLVNSGKTVKAAAAELGLSHNGTFWRLHAAESLGMSVRRTRYAPRAATEEVEGGGGPRCHCGLLLPCTCPGPLRAEFFTTTGPGLTRAVR